jgi:hypothetical protein
MVKTVNSAFDEFLKSKVNLDQNKTIKARNSRNWLINQIHEFPNRDNNFPKFYSSNDINFGSFARKTQIRPLDDIDFMVCISAEGSSYDSSITNNIHEIIVPEKAEKLKKLCNDGNNTLNSIKVVNKFKKLLKNIPQYDKANLKRKGEAVTLKLTSYDWNFDIVPCFFTVADHNDRTYYLIPDGNGKWKKTDPRMDRDRVSTINPNNNGKVLNAIRLMKYWNKRPTMPSMPSYLIENMVLDYYETNQAGNYIDYEIKYLLKYIKDNIFYSVQDPKGIQGDINTLSFDEKTKIKNRADSDYDKAILAGEFETNKDQKSAINKWKEIFGSEFTEYS